RDIEDLVLLLDVLAKPHALSPFGRSAPDFARNHAPADLRGKRIAWLGDWGGAYPCEPGILESCADGLAVLSTLGAEVVPLDPPFSADAIWESWTTLRSLVIYGSKRDLLANPETYQLIKPETRWEIERGASLTAEQITKASQIRSDWYVA